LFLRTITFKGTLAMSDETFDDFLIRREAASGAYISGKPLPLLELSTRRDPATFFPPSGARVLGATAVNQANEQGAAAFASGGTGRFDIFQSGSSGDLGYWTGVHHADVVLGGKPMTMELRTTEIFRNEEGEWKLIHRHADTLSPPA
jgi:ketosteroid isomerase-like protein